MAFATQYWVCESFALVLVISGLLQEIVLSSSFSAKGKSHLSWSSHVHPVFLFVSVPARSTCPALSRMCLSKTACTAFSTICSRTAACISVQSPRDPLNRLPGG